MAIWPNMANMAIYGHPKGMKDEVKPEGPKTVPKRPVWTSSYTLLDKVGGILRSDTDTFELKKWAEIAYFVEKSCKFDPFCGRILF